MTRRMFRNFYRDGNFYIIWEAHERTVPLCFDVLINKKPLKCLIFMHFKDFYYWSERRESNPHYLLGKQKFCH